MLQISSLTAGYGAAPVLRDFSLNVAAGQVAAVIGPNGCGKSTLLRCVAGLLPPRTGGITIDGRELRSLPDRERARTVALLPQHFEGGGELPVEEMVLLGRTPYLPPYGTPGVSDRQIAARCMADTVVESLRNRRVGSLSGGERQRVILARALAQQPRVLLLDEPTSNLDIRYQHEILTLVLQLARNEALVTILVLHQINLAAAAADTLVLLDPSGTTRAAGCPQDVMTAENLQAVYGMPLRVVQNPRTGRPMAQSEWDFNR